LPHDVPDDLAHHGRIPQGPDAARAADLRRVRVSASDRVVGRVVVAIDGPAASGKSSTAHWVAERVGLRHVDSGALYRAATAAQLRREADATRWTESSVVEAAAVVALVAQPTAFLPVLAGAAADDEIRGPGVTRYVSQVAQMPAVRDWVNGQVRALARDYDLVVDGRDIGTVVFPSATLKVFLVADPWERARRRVIERLGRGPTEAEIADETERLVHRDALDATQTVQAKDAVLIDTTSLTQEEQVQRIVALIEAAVLRLRGHRKRI
jgi:cytidylate kinase